MNPEKTRKDIWTSLKDFYRLYTAGLSRSEIERLLKCESADVFSYYRRGSNSDRKTEQKPGAKGFWVIKEIFLSFLLKLTPARRLVYGISFAIFIVAVVGSQWVYATLAFLILNILLAFELADKMLAKDELEIAREIQMGLQPVEGPELQGFDVAAFYQPAREVGGDYYDLMELDDGRFAVIIGDVSGKGLPAALYAVKLQGLFESFMRQSLSPKEILTRINEIVCQRLKKQYFITAVLAIIDSKKQSIVMARAGHLPAVHFRKNSSGGEFEILESDGLGIGLDNSHEFSVKLEEITIQYKKDDIFLFYTDGITEARNALKEEFGERRLRKTVLNWQSLPADNIKEKMINDVSSFTNKALLDDDATVVILKAV